MWCVKQLSPKEVHVYPLDEPGHVLSDALCRCHPEVRYGGNGRTVVHQAARAPLKPAYPAHWIALVVTK